MNTTDNYQLSQWDGADRILREDFNADNRKTEEALASLRQEMQQQIDELKAANRYEKLLDYTSSTSSNQLNISLDGIRLLDYSRLDIHLESAASASAFYLRLNGSTDYTGGETGSINISQTYLAYCPNFAGKVSLEGRLFPLPTDDFCLFTYQQDDNSQFTICRSVCPLKPSAIRTLNVVCENSSQPILPGFRVIIHGIKR